MTSTVEAGTITENATTNFTTTATLEGQESNNISNVDAEKIQRAAVGSFGGTTPGSFQFRATSHNTTTDGTQAGLNLASDPNSQIRVMTVHTSEQGSVAGLNASSLAITTAGATQQAAQVLAQSEITENSNAGAVTVTVDNTDGTKYTYYPAVQTADASGGAGQFYVMMSPQDMIPNVPGGNNPQRIIAPRGHPITTIGDGAAFAVETDSIPVEFRKVETGSRSARDERRRATHNEVERKRRTKINSWIDKLAYMVPECKQDQTKAGQSKGVTLSKTIDFIDKLRTQNERLNERLGETGKDQERLMVENQLLRQQMEEIRRENSLLRANLHMHQQHEQSEMATDVQQIDSAQ